MIVHSISKSKALASLPSKKIAAMFLSSNKVLLSQPRAFQLLRDKFWASFAARHQLKFGPDPGPDPGPDLLRIHHLNLKEIDIPPSLSMPSTDADADADADASPPRVDTKEINETSLRQRHLARKDLLKNAHMKASSRFMNRGDGELSRGYSLGSTKADIPRSQSSKHALPVTFTSSLVNDIAAAKSHRERMYQHFWESHKRRKDKAAASQGSKEDMSPRSSQTVRKDKHRPELCA